MKNWQSTDYCSSNYPYLVTSSLVSPLVTISLPTVWFLSLFTMLFFLYLTFYKHRHDSVSVRPQFSRYSPLQKNPINTVVPHRDHKIRYFCESAIFSLIVFVQYSKVWLSSWLTITTCIHDHIKSRPQFCPLLINLDPWFYYVLMQNLCYIFILDLNFPTACQKCKDNNQYNKNKVSEK